ncbi:MAG: potassium/proton antiporter, partial [Synergistaceae bacterium]|nr:potassium/proton antiporter [Synergistaceae bacterium]
TEGHPQAKFMFNVIFFVVITSVMLQGKTLAWFAQLLKIDAPVREAKTWTLNFDITPASGTDETREVDLPDDAVVIGREVKDLRFPDGVTILLINRGDKYLIPKGGTVLEQDDTLLLFGDRAKLTDVAMKLCERAENNA